MLFYYFFCLFAAISTVFARKKYDRKLCIRKLEGILYEPKNCANNYLRTITETLRAQGPLLWTKQAKGIIDRFEATYDIAVIIINAMGQVGSFNSDGEFVQTVLETVPLVAKDHSYARSNALREGFTSKILGNPFDVYNTIVWNPAGEMYNLRVVAEVSKTPISC